MEPIDELRLLCREDQVPFFEETELWYQLGRAGGDVNLAAYRCLIIKAENCTVQVSGLTLSDTSAYASCGLCAAFRALYHQRRVISWGWFKAPIRSLRPLNGM